jgi:hypothetical protein
LLWGRLLGLAGPLHRSEARFQPLRGVQFFE